MCTLNGGFCSFVSDKYQKIKCAVSYFDLLPTLRMLNSNILFVLCLSHLNNIVFFTHGCWSEICTCIAL